jgi:hypothetical protein
MVDSFDIEFEDTAHHFTNSSEDSIIGLNGYAEVLYNGITTLYIKHKKEIFRLSQGSTNDVFEESNRVYVFKNGKINKVNNPKDFIALLEDKKQEITSFIKTKKLKISRKTPESLVPILKYYDSLVY